MKAETVCRHRKYTRGKKVCKFSIIVLGHMSVYKYTRVHTLFDIRLSHYMVPFWQLHMLTTPSSLKCTLDHYSKLAWLSIANCIWIKRNASSCFLVTTGFKFSSVVSKRLNQFCRSHDSQFTKNFTNVEVIKMIFFEVDIWFDITFNYLI